MIEDVVRQSPYPQQHHGGDVRIKVVTGVM